MRTTTRYPQWLRERAAIGVHPGEVGVNKKTLRRWVRRSQADRGL